MSDRVSIIIPVYNSEKTIARCLNSVVCQTYSDIEVIVVNDGSNDNSEQILQSFSEKDDRVKVISVRNGGVSAARNIGLENASGKYVQFIDSDDYIEFNMTEKLIEMMKDRDVDFVATGYFNHTKTEIINCSYSEKLLENRKSIVEALPYMYTNKIINLLWNKLYKKELITEQFMPGVQLGEDVLFNLAYMNNVKTMLIDSRAYYHYISVVSEKNLSSKYYSRAGEYLNLEFDALLDAFGESKNKNMRFLKTAYLRELVRVIRKAAHKNISDTEFDNLIQCVSKFYESNFDAKSKVPLKWTAFEKALLRRKKGILWVTGKSADFVFTVINKRSKL